MTLEQLRIFIAVAERQHVTRAAEALNLTQSAASAAVAALEARHGSKLFNRVGRGIELTEAGHIFLDEARAVLARAEMAELRLAELAGLKRGRLLIQASQTIASYWLPRHLVEYRRSYPGIEIRLSVGNTADAAEAVSTGAAELGFVEGLVERPQLKVTEVARDQLIVVVAPDHPWASRRTLGADDLIKAEWVLREPGSGTRSVFEDALAKMGVPVADLNVALELPTNEAVRAAVEAGMGATALSASAAVSSLEAGLLSKAALALPARSFNLIQQIEREPGHAARALIDSIVGKRRPA
ncbi:LysR family transcriptional regulator [uncultured Methylovirgula sp.]|uniref:LysR family transcriptional regulator n=1 Tax=uncultured Methylovirgula sp. TaxID=1285960 RepID=UPI002604408C|nr:LysR family transcriptional regulator [uncultured Methylovirgula sp.]